MKAQIVGLSVTLLIPILFFLARIADSLDTYAFELNKKLVKNDSIVQDHSLILEQHEQRITQSELFAKKAKKALPMIQQPPPVRPGYYHVVQTGNYFIFLSVSDSNYKFQKFINIDGEDSNPRTASR